MKKNRKERVVGLKALGAAVGVTVALAQASRAADLNTELVVNGGFESVDPSITTAYGNSEVSGGWVTDSEATVFAYNYGQAYDDRNDAGEVPPGNDPVSSTDYYFTLNGVDVPAIQNIDLSTGDSAALIAVGSAQFNIGAYFTNYLDDFEGGQLTLEFYDGDPGAGGFEASLIGEPVVYIDENIDEWSLTGGSGMIPATARWARIILDKNPDTEQSGGPDVYVDNVSFQVTSGTGGGASDLVITSIMFPEAGTVSLTWTSIPGIVYGVEYSADMTEWLEITDSVDSEGIQTSYRIVEDEIMEKRLFYRVFPVEQ